jgi:hypothetical protein
MKELGCGNARKMQAVLDEPVSYTLPLGEELIDMNSLLGRSIKLTFTGEINCIYCNRKTKKSFNQGYCYPCCQRLARCDMCIVSPEKCHFEKGTCREPDWAEEHCFIGHVIYLANTSAPKVGITRNTQIPTRWIDQGATEALPVFNVDNRYHSGLIEHMLKDHIADKTNWRAMLKGDGEPVDLVALSRQLTDEIQEGLADFRVKYGKDAISPVEDASPRQIRYPVMEYPKKVVSHNLDKTPEVEGVLQGIKGQYLLLDTGVLNIRKYTAYELSLQA